MEKNERIAVEVLEKVGGKDNITFATHCVTRLRLNLKDESAANDEEVKKINGVIGVAHSGGQYQIIIGQNVPKVYEHVCRLTGLQAQAAVNENQDAPKEKLTLKQVGKNIMNYLSKSMIALIPILIASAMFKTALVVLGPDMCNVITPESDTYILLNMVYNALYYFLPIFLGYSAAKNLNASIPMGMMMGSLLLVPDFVNLIGAKETLSIYGVFPAPVASYAQSVVPVLLSVWLMTYPEKFFKKYIPDTLSTIFVPTLTLIIMVPVLFCVCAPIGNYLGNIIGNGLIAFGNFGGFIAVAVVAALWEFLVMTGMHQVLIMFAIATMLETGSDNFILVAGGIATWAAFGMALGAFFRQKNKEAKAESSSYFVSGFLGGVTEPVLFGLGFQYKKPFIGLIIGGLCGGLYAGLTHVATYVMGATNFLGVLGFVAGGTSNLVNGIIASVMAMLISAIVTFILGGFDDEEKTPEVQPEFSEIIEL
ncbi:MAG: PTS transporter subunit EIIC [Allobaculum sp.]